MIYVYQMTEYILYKSRIGIENGSTKFQQLLAE